MKRAGGAPRSLLALILGSLACGGKVAGFDLTGADDPILLSMRTASGDPSPAGCAVGTLSFEGSPRRMVLSEQPGDCDPSYGSGAVEISLVPL